MALYNRAAPGRKPNYWCSYAISEELRVRWGLADRTQREPCGTGDKRAAQAVYAQRKREVREGTWRPRTAGRGQTVQQYAEAWLTKREADGVRAVRTERQRLSDYVYPIIGQRAIGEVRRDDVRAVVAKLSEHVSERTGRPLAPRTVRDVYMALHAMYEDALADELVLANPCTLKEKRGELPAKKDADPRWRSHAVFTRDEVEALISDDRIPEVRRVLWALMALGGLRVGEAVAREWRDYDARAVPLGRLHCPTQHDGRELKTQDPRDVPVHPTLAKVLASWKLRGCAMLVGRAPQPSDYIVPKHDGTGPRDGRRVWQDLQKDLAALGLRPRRAHDFRRTFISLAVGDGADKYVLSRVTHGRPNRDAFDAYAEVPWASLCEQVGKLRLELRSTDNVVQLQRGR